MRCRHRAYHDALLEQGGEALLRHRLAEQEALAEIAAHADERHRRVGGLFQADAHGKGAKAVSEIDHGFTDWRMDLVGAAADHERAIGAR